MIVSWINQTANTLESLDGGLPGNGIQIAGILQIGADRVVRRHLAVFNDTGFDQKPWRVADRSDNLVIGDEISHLLNGHLIGPKDIRVDLATRQDETDVVFDVDVGNLEVCLDTITPIAGLPPSDGFAVQGRNVNGCASFC
ncbi:hypothetical protein SAMN04515647_2533 [Cohaesibacter sp. ES.047]|nr:hypothetical protein SAMN04515647_2533 [Cohaesibacter sp. ES.047]